MYSDNNLEPAGTLKDLADNHKKWHKKWWGRIILFFLTIFLIIFCALGFYFIRVTYLLRTGRITVQDLFGPNPAVDSVKDTSVLFTAEDPAVGPKDAKVIVVEFFDFKCSACQSEYSVIKQLMKDYQGQVKFVFRNFPIIDSDQSLLLALVAQCAHQQGKFFEMQDKIFSIQPADVDEAGLKVYAQQIGLNSLQFNSCFDSRVYLDEIERDFTDGSTVGVAATPTFFINGIKIVGAIPLHSFQRLIDQELNKLD